MVFSKSIGDQKLLQRKITRNPRYANIESRLDTGASVTRYEKRVTDIQENFKIKQNEIFKRVKLSSFAELILQVAEQDRIAQLTDLVNNAGLECPIPSSGIQKDDILNNCPVPSSGPGLMDVISGTSEREKNNDSGFKSSRGGPQKGQQHTSLMDVISGNGERYLEKNQHLYSRTTPRKNSVDMSNQNLNPKTQNPNPEPARTFQSVTNPNKTIPFAPLDQRSYTTLSQVISGTGEKINDSDFEKQESGDFDSEKNKKNPEETPYENCPFLLLDVQKEHLFDRCHIRCAINYDPSALNRTMNPYTDEIRDFMNKDEKIIVVYDENEDLAAKVVTTLAERGVNNVFLLSGGLKLIARRGLDHLVTGPYPRVCFREDIERAKQQVPRRNFEQPGPQNLVDQYRMKFTDSELAQLRFELDKYNEESSAASSVFSQPRSARPRARTSVGSSVGGRSRISTGAPGWK